MSRNTASTKAEVSAVEQIYQAWDDALGREDLEAAMALYAPDCTLESPLVRHILGRERGIVDGRADLRAFVTEALSRTPPLRQRHRTGFFTDGRKLMWEYPRLTEEGEQMDLVEVMEIDDGLIQRHRVYWGWRALKVLEDNAYRAGA
jgi:hypothetical protein